MSHRHWDKPPMTSPLAPKTALRQLQRMKTPANQPQTKTPKYADTELSTKIPGDAKAATPQFSSGSPTRRIFTWISHHSPGQTATSRQLLRIATTAGIASHRHLHQSSRPGSNSAAPQQPINTKQNHLDEPPLLWSLDQAMASRQQPRHTAKACQLAYKILEQPLLTWPTEQTTASRQLHCRITATAHQHNAQTPGIATAVLATGTNSGDQAATSPRSSNDPPTRRIKTWTSCHRSATRTINGIQAATPHKAPAHQPRRRHLDALKTNRPPNLRRRPGSDSATQQRPANTTQNHLDPPPLLCRHHSATRTINGTQAATTHKALAHQPRGRHLEALPMDWPPNLRRRPGSNSAAQQQPINTKQNHLDEPPLLRSLDQAMASRQQPRHTAKACQLAHMTLEQPLLTWPTEQTTASRQLHCRTTATAHQHNAQLPGIATAVLATGTNSGDQAATSPRSSNNPLTRRIKTWTSRHRYATRTINGIQAATPHKAPAHQPRRRLLDALKTNWPPNLRRRPGSDSATQQRPANTTQNHLDPPPLLWPLDQATASRQQPRHTAKACQLTHMILKQPLLTWPTEQTTASRQLHCRTTATAHQHNAQLPGIATAVLATGTNSGDQAATSPRSSNNPLTRCTKIWTSRHRSATRTINGIQAATSYKSLAHQPPKTTPGCAANGLATKPFGDAQAETTPHSNGPPIRCIKLRLNNKIIIKPVNLKLS
ncbi:uncharacterized protein Dana_GF26706 [Drosophila ananassae]|uniref:Uncharacterized protein n=1 Tax=Drosophila ananassae TaxID=7217 RepID=A0A0P8Y5E7_DROAN|nr:uncharacterized protein Dana_GF26706 [Drosophila ananassae]